MAKILLVEDDANLREIYSIRLTAEGYEVISAGDGEEALASAVREKPDLILSDVMMPKISGFDMLDILRQTPETKDIKVIMMTALSSEDQRERGNALGANRYLVKSQVGIEDVVNAVHEVLESSSAAPTENVPSTEPNTTAPAPAAQPTPAPVAPAPAPVTSAPAAQPIPVVAQPASTVSAPEPTPVMEPVAPVIQPATTPITQPTPAPVAPAPAAAAAPAPVAPAPAMPQDTQIEQNGYQA